MTDIDALLPCPMCGDEARVCQWKDTEASNATWIECPNCSVMTDTFYDPSPDEAIRNAASVWNRRFPSSADALTTERAKVAALEAGNRDLQLHFDVAMDDMKRLEAEVARGREVAMELVVELNRIADVTERWTYSLVSQVNEIARAALARFKEESGQ